MDVTIIATKACTHRKNLEKELDCLHIPYRIFFVEDSADLVEEFSIRHSPNLIVDARSCSGNSRRKRNCMPTLTPKSELIPKSGFAQ